jgi:VCBS repeat-containing protein
VSNPAPIAVDNTYTGAGEDSGPTVIGNALTDNDGGVDSDPDGDSLALVAASNVAGTNGGLFTVATNGTVTFDANGDFENLAVGETATTSYTYTLTDGEGGTDTATVTVEVTGANDAPTALPDVTSTPERTPVSGQLIGTDIDGDKLEFSLSDRPKNGTVIVKPNGSYTYVPADGFQGRDTFTVLVSDGNGGTALAVVTVNVTPNPSAGFEQFLPVEAIPAPTPDIPVAPLEFQDNQGVIANTVDAIGYQHASTDLSQNGIILNTVNGLGSLRGISAAGASILETNNSIRMGEMAANAASLLGADIEAWHTKGSTGFSLRTDIDGMSAIGDASRNGQIIVDTLVTDRIVYVEMSNDLDPTKYGHVVEYNVRQADGRPLPTWTTQADNGLLLAEPPAGETVIEAEIIAVFEDGSTLSHRVAIQLATGEIERLDNLTAPAPMTFQEQLKAASDGPFDEVRNLRPTPE